MVLQQGINQSLVFNYSLADHALRTCFEYLAENCALSTNEGNVFQLSDSERPIHILSTLALFSLCCMLRKIRGIKLRSHAREWCRKLHPEHCSAVPHLAFSSWFSTKSSAFSAAGEMIAPRPLHSDRRLHHKLTSVLWRHSVSQRISFWRAMTDNDHVIH